MRQFRSSFSSRFDLSFFSSFNFLVSHFQFVPKPKRQFQLTASSMQRPSSMARLLLQARGYRPGGSTLHQVWRNPRDTSRPTLDECQILGEKVAAHLSSIHDVQYSLMPYQSLHNSVRSFNTPHALSALAQRQPQPKSNVLFFFAMILN